MKKGFSKKEVKEIKTLKKIYAVRLALAETLTEKAVEIEQKILSENSFKDKDGNIIKDQKKAYLIDQESGDFDRFFLIRKQEMRKAGLGHPQDEEGVSVDAVAKYKVLEAGRRIFKFVLKTLPKEQREIIEFAPFKIIDGKTVYDTIIDLFMRMEIN